MKKYKRKEVREMLRESNFIEREYGEEELTKALKAWDYLVSVELPLRERDILAVHNILMEGLLPPKERGHFRTVPVWVGRREGMNHLMIRDAIDQWVLNANDLVENGKKEPVVWKERMVKLHHVNFEKVHPWIDGNGRSGRILMNWERMHLGLPILIIHADWPDEDGDQRRYYSWFKK
jgi:Fic family protein